VKQRQRERSLSISEKLSVCNIHGW
jgi:hypothetical protein